VKSWSVGAKDGVQKANPDHKPTCVDGSLVIELQHRCRLKPVGCKEQLY